MIPKIFASFLESGSSSALKAFSGFIAVLFITRSFGGDALISYSQIGSFVNFAVALSAFGVFNGVTRELSISTDEDRAKIFSGVGFLGLITVLAFFVMLLLTPESMVEVSPEFRRERNTIFAFVPLTVLLVIIGGTFLSVQSSASDITSYARTHSVASIFVILGSTVIYFVAPQFLIYFAMISPLSPYLIATVRARKLIGSILNFRGLDFITVRHLFSYFPPALMQTLFPLFYIFLRNYLLGRLEVDQIAGWQLVMRVSDAYMGILFTILVSKVLGEFSKSSSGTERKSVLMAILPNTSFILIATIALTLTVDAWASLFIMSGKVSSKDVLLYGIGDSLRIASNVIYFYFLSRRQTFTCVVLDIFQMAFLSLGYYIAVTGLPGISLSVGHLLCHIFFLVSSMLIFHRRRRS